MTASNVYTIIFTLTTLVKVSFCSLVVPTLQGLVVGKYNDGAKVFLGIPFAEPPVGPLRWRSPVQKRPWGIHFATNYGPKCPQTPCNTDYSFGRPCSNVMSEDCLQLNIYVPIRTKPFHKLATLVFIHGGFFHLGSAVSPLFHGEKFVRKSDVILVTLNYRIGALGSLWTADGPGGIKGNFGIQDQRLAVKWVYNNIRNFGGDPDRISIFGRSAGASYAAIHLVNRMLDRYIKGAIIMSAPFGIGTKSAEQAISVGRSFSQNLNCDPYDPTCLRSKTTEEIINAQRSADLSSLSLLKRFVPWAPFFDSEFPIDLLPAFREGLIGVRNVIIGVTKEEDARYTYDFFPDPISIEAYRENIIPGLLPDQASEMLERYVPLDPDDTRPTVRQVFDDVVFTCPSRRAALDLSRNGLRSVWFYVFDNVLRFLQGTDILLECQQYSCHGNENALLFQTIEKFDYRFTPADQRLADELTAAWTNFAKYGSPIWPRYNRVLRLYKLFKVLGSPVLSDFRGRACSQFDQDGFNA